MSDARDMKFSLIASINVSNNLMVLDDDWICDSLSDDGMFVCCMFV
jgi:hypothetical protein